MNNTRLNNAACPPLGPQVLIDAGGQVKLTIKRKGAEDDLADVEMMPVAPHAGMPVVAQGQLAVPQPAAQITPSVLVAPQMPVPAAPVVSLPIVSKTTFTFVAGPLGVALHRPDEENASAVLSVADGMQAQQMGVPVGATILAVNEHSTAGKGHQEVLEMIKGSGRPLRLLLAHQSDAAPTNPIQDLSDRVAQMLAPQRQEAIA